MSGPGLIAVGPGSLFDVLAIGATWNDIEGRAKLLGFRRIAAQKGKLTKLENCSNLLLTCFRSPPGALHGSGQLFDSKHKVAAESTQERGHLRPRKSVDVVVRHLCCFPLRNVGALF